MSAVGYAIAEAWVSLKRSGRSAVISIATIAIAFLTLAGFLLISVNVQGALDRWLEAAEMSVYLLDTASESERNSLEDFLRSQPGVAAVEYVSKERALERFRADFPELRDVSDNVGTNPFPSALEVRLRTDYAGSAAIDTLSQDVGERAGVADVRHDRAWLSRLTGVVTTARVAGGLAAAILLLGAAFTVAAVVRLSLYARRGELEIMQLVGAPISYIRGPAIVEGLLLGGIGAALALTAIAIVYSTTATWLGPSVAGLTGTTALRFLGPLESATLILGGVGVGAAAGAVAARAAR